MPASAVRSRRLLLRGTGGGEGATLSIPFTQGAVGGEVALPFDIDKGMVAGDLVVRFQQAGGIAMDAVLPFDILGPIGASVALPFDILSGAWPVDGTGAVLSPATGYWEPD